MSILGKVSSGLRVLGYSFVPVAGDGVVKLARLVATKVLTKNDPFQMRQWELGISTLLGAALIWRLPVTRIPAALIYVAYKAVDLWVYFTGERSEHNRKVFNLVSYAEYYDADAIAWLWETQPYLFKYSNEEGKNLLHLALENGNEALFKWIHGVGLFPALNVPSQTGWKPLHFAVQNGHLECVKTLYSFDKDAVTEEAPGAGNLLAIAAKADQSDIVEWLDGETLIGKLVKGDNNALFEHALQKDSRGTAVLEWIYNKKIQDNKKEEALTKATSFALRENNLKIAEWVWQKSTHFIGDCHIDDLTVAAQRGHSKILEWLWERDESPIRKSGVALLREAIKHGQLDVAEWLNSLDRAWFDTLGAGIVKQAHRNTSEWASIRLLKPRG